MQDSDTPTFELPALISEFVPLNRRRVHGNPPLSVDELERWTLLREVLEYHFGSAAPPRAGSRRRALRVPTHLKVSIRGASDSVSKLHDISEGGVFIETSELLSLGSTLKLEIDPVDGGKPLRVDGVVMWRREIANMDGPSGVGVEFRNLEHDDFAILDRLIDQALNAAPRCRE